MNQTVKALLEKFAGRAPYPKGNIRFNVPSEPIEWAGRLAYSNWLSEQELILTTDGGGNLAAILRTSSMVSLGLGIGAAALGLPEVAAPLLRVSGIAAGAGAAVNIFDRLERGSFERDLETAVDLLDIATALLSAGALSGSTQMIRGAGKVTLSQRLTTGMGVVQLGIAGYQHVEDIDKSMDSGDPKKVKQALLAALRTGALVLIVHRAKGGRPAPRLNRRAPSPKSKLPRHRQPRL